MDTDKMLSEFDLDTLDAFERMQYNKFIENFSNEESLQMLINAVDGDYSQLSDGLAEIAILQDENE